MAKIHEETVVITLSKLIREQDTTPQDLASNEICDALQAVAEQLLGDGIVVEVVRA